MAIPIDKQLGLHMLIPSTMTSKSSFPLIIKQGVGDTGSCKKVIPLFRLDAVLVVVSIPQVTWIYSITF